MKNLKDILNEAYLLEDFFGNVGSTPEDNKRRKIEAWLRKYDIRNYAINKDLTIDIDGDILLIDYPEETIPEYIQFGKVKECFSVAHSNLISLRGCPKEVGDAFSCSMSENLKSLEYSPENVKGIFDCTYCDKLEALEGAPEHVGSSFKCTGCKNLKSLKGSPKTIYKSFWCEFCPKLKDLTGGPKYVWDTFTCNGCDNLTSIKGCPEKVSRFDCTNCKKLKQVPTLDTYPGTTVNQIIS